LAGTERTLVAVGTVRLAAMFAAVRADAPRSRNTSVSGTGGADGAAADGVVAA
jgi:hypothetical protein